MDALQASSVALNFPSDPASLASCILILVQVIGAVLLRIRTYRPLRARCKMLEKVPLVLSSSGVDQGRVEKLLGGESYQDVREQLAAWEQFVKSGVTRDEAIRETNDLFASSALLPSAFSPRIDLAAPGMFIATGILGTFIGLIIAFMSAGDQGSPNVGLLMQTMIYPFLNSAVGVLLALWFTYFSRRLRHRFDSGTERIRALLRRPARSLPSQSQRAAALINAVNSTLLEISTISAETLMHGRRIADQLSTVTDSLTQGFASVVSTTTASSQQLVQDLAPKLEESMRTLVNAPFSELTATINKLDTNTRILTERQVEIVAQMQEAGEALGHAQTLMATTTTEIATQASALAASSDSLAEGGRQIGLVTSEARRSIEHLEQVHEAIQVGADRLQDVLNAFDKAGTSMDRVTTVLGDNAQRYDEGAARFNAAVAGLRDTMATALDGSVQPVAAELRSAAASMQTALSIAIGELRGDLERTMATMASSLADSSSRTIDAYANASTGVNRVLEDHMDGVVDRLNGQLGALQRMVPDEVSRLTQATTHSAKTLERSVKQLEAVVGTVNDKTTQSLRGHLVAYDKAVAEIHERLAGTLSLWDARAEALESAVLRLATNVERLR